MTPQEIAKEIDALERKGMSRADAERMFWAAYHFVENDNHPSFSLMLEQVIHSHVADVMVGKVGYLKEQ